MTVKARYQLYSTDGCHLCDLAYELVVALEQTSLVEIVDIVDDDELVESYGTEIPVIRHMASGWEINWPFDGEQLAAFFSHCEQQV